MASDIAISIIHLTKIQTLIQNILRKYEETQGDHMSVFLYILKTKSEIKDYVKPQVCI